MEVLQPSGWPRPKGYANGVIAEGRLVILAGQIGWTCDERFESDDLVDQIRQALTNIGALLHEAGCTSAELVRLTWYVTDIAEWRARQSEIGAVYRDTLGRVFPPMACVAVAALVEPRAKVEIEATAVIPPPLELAAP